MDRQEIVAAIKKILPDFEPLSVSRDHADEIRIKVAPRSFRESCITLHAILPSPVVMLFAQDERKASGVFVIRCVLFDGKNGRWVIVTMDIPAAQGSYESLSKYMHSAALFEREIREMFGVEPEGSPDLRRLHLHDEVWPEGNYPLRKDFVAAEGIASGAYPFGRVDGEGVFEVPVGPVHAGIIGPGHFRFSVAGEPIVNLEIRLGFTHRGAEKLFEGKTLADAVTLSECIAGDAAFAHSLAFTHAAEKITGETVSNNAAYMRAIFLELERMYNHVNDIGGIAVDVSFSFPAAYASIIKEAILRLNEKISGSRYLKGANAVGGVRVDGTDGTRAALLAALKDMRHDFRELIQMLCASASFMDRVDTTGVLRRKTARDLGVLGLVGRASGIAVDLRKTFPGVYEEARFAMAVEASGDVLARLRVRVAEFEESCRLIEVFAGKLAGSEKAKGGATVRAGSALGYAEGWRGPVLYWVETDAAGKITRCKIVDASFHNWQGLSYAVLGNIIPDFPLCNKSFDLSYAGNDL